MTTIPLVPYPPVKGSRIRHEHYGLGTVTQVTLPKSALTKKLVGNMCNAYGRYFVDRGEERLKVSEEAMKHALTISMEESRYAAAVVRCTFDYAPSTTHVSLDWVHHHRAVTVLTKKV